MHTNCMQMTHREGWSYTRADRATPRQMLSITTIFESQFDDEDTDLHTIRWTSFHPQSSNAKTNTCNFIQKRYLSHCWNSKKLLPHSAIFSLFAKFIIFGDVGYWVLNLLLCTKFHQNMDDFLLTYGDLTIFKMATVRHLFETCSLCHVTSIATLFCFPWLPS